MLHVTNMIQDTIHPNVTMFTECGEENIDGKPVVVPTVRRGTARPYYLVGKGIWPEDVYLRQGASSVPASEMAILNMIEEDQRRLLWGRLLSELATDLPESGGIFCAP